MSCIQQMVRPVAILNYLQLLGMGGYGTYLNLDFATPTQLVMCLYLVFLGALGLAFEAKLKIVVEQLPFIATRSGKAMYFFLVGTMGLSYGPSGGNPNLIPFISGCLSIIATLVATVAICCKERQENEQSNAINSKAAANEQTPILGAASKI